LCDSDGLDFVVVWLVTVVVPVEVRTWVVWTVEVVVDGAKVTVVGTKGHGNSETAFDSLRN
jgi:hypothetical protein